jgi:peptidyl-prolyl cis-trans isomerase C
MPESISRVAFQLKKGDISEPFRTSFGMHLLTVTDRRPGQLSLEDVRPIVLEAISDDLWRDTVRDLREKARIEWAEQRDGAGAERR